MITGFGSKTDQDIYDGTNSKHSRKLPNELHEKARRLLDQINASPSLDVLRVPPGNQLQKLGGNLKGFWSLRINDQWRIIFRWKENDAHDVDVTDYH
ncbi:MAG: plasmid maintenance system killer protein [Nitrospinae bacterium CG11_big_fil_rev_8_21_14_0_20_56_8]|nr:MAG: plasmid maintenance system killer protein [Nitrospinae bacterium CG11_big_fil_rev_8_21_14_0_20_56_8]